MPTVKTLLARTSCGAVEAPAPDTAQLDMICQAAMRAADHARLRPWRFLVIEGEGRVALGQILAAAAVTRGDDGDKVARKTLRAPMIIVAIASLHEHAKVPEIEQWLSAGAAVQNMLNAAYALGLGAYWRTGAAAYDRSVMQALELAPNEHIVGFVYVGTPKEPLAVAQNQADTSLYFSRWPAAYAQIRPRLSE